MKKSVLLKLSMVLSVISLCLVTFGSVAAYRNVFLLPETNEISTVSAQGTFGNINQMSADELEKLPGIGKALAARIVEYRNQHGEFKNPEEIMNIKGIGKGKFENLKDIIYTKR